MIINFMVMFNANKIALYTFLKTSWAAAHFDNLILNRIRKTTACSTTKSSVSRAHAQLLYYTNTNEVRAMRVLTL